MNCEEALSLLYEMIDKEASEIDAEEVQKHLEHCESCQGIYKIEGSVNEFIQARLRNGSAECAHAKLKANILRSLDDIDESSGHEERPGKSRRTPRPFRFPAVALAAAAALVILVGAGYFGSRMYSHQRLFIPIEEAHWTDQSEIAPQISDSELTLAMSHATENYNYELRQTVDDFHLVGGHSEEIMGQSIMHYVYRNDGKKVSVFLAPAEFFSRFADSDMEQVVRDTLTMFDHNCRGCRVVFHRVGDVLVITASSDREVELLDFIPGHIAT